MTTMEDRLKQRLETIHNSKKNGNVGNARRKIKEAMKLFPKNKELQELLNSTNKR